MYSSIERAFADARSVLDQFSADPDVAEGMDLAVAEVVQCFRSGGKILCCGNGGSMCDAMHFAEEFSGRFRDDRPPLAAIALSDPAHMSCVGNDYGFEKVFSRQVEALGKPSDILLILSTSGNSPNILAAARAASSAGVKVIGLLGRGGGEVSKHCDLVILAPGPGSDRIQELHMLALHSIIEAAEIELGYAESATR